MKYVDNWLNKITMYRLVLDFLIILLTFAVGLGFFGKFSFGGLDIIISTLFLVSVCYVTNKIFSRVFDAPVNTESVYITALILALIISPGKSFNDFVFLMWIGVLAMAAKYILAIGKKHIFNPAAVAAVLTATGIGQSASWWVGNLMMLPLVLVGGYLIVRKIEREDMVWYFLRAVLLTVLAFTLLSGNNVWEVSKQLLLHTSVFFFAFVMLTEPLTTPPTKRLQMWYGIIVGVLFAPQIHLGSVYSTPELAIVAGNIFSYVVSPKIKLVLKLKEKILIAPNTYDFVFSLVKNINFTPGQYMEFTLGHTKTDDRGNRRYFTLASSPTENNLRIWVKFYNPSSSYKTKILELDNKTSITTAQLAGDFVMPQDMTKKLVFMAGGIGITPFRSMIKYMIDKKQKRDVVLLYSNKNADEFVYDNVFVQAKSELGIKTIYTITDPTNLTSGWNGKIGRVDKGMIEKEIPDYLERRFYLSGPHKMVMAFKETLKEMSIPINQIVTDYFPGYT